MSGPLHLTPPVIPSSKSKTPSKHPPPNETDIDKFATLFNPQTPPASPTLPPIFIQSKPTSSIRSASFNTALRQGHVKQESIGTPISADSEFGSFVSVPPAQDPLSASFFPASPSAFSPRLPSHTITGSTSLSHSVQHQRKHGQNPSLVFFGQFTEDAKVRGEQRRAYLNELLQHEDDPLYWVKPEGESRRLGAEESGRGAETGMGNEHRHDQEMMGIAKVVDGGAEEESSSSLELDFDADSRPSSGSSSTNEGRPPLPNSTKPFSTPSLSPAFRASRSPPLPHPRSPPRPTSTEPSTTRPFSSTSAPQIIRAASSSSVPHPKLSSSLSSSFSPSPSSSHGNSLSSLSSRWMSSLISTSRPSAPSTSADEHPPSLHSIFASPSSTSTTTDNDELPHDSDPLYPDKNHHQHRNSLPASPRATAISLLKPHQSHTLPVAVAVPVPVPAPSSSSFSSTTVGSFIPSSSISHGTPFASRPYVPPSGAPGFAGDHAWDRGFSDDFDRERVERRSVVRLEGRKGMTSVVLDVGLASMIRAHLPALARLPRTWNLLYSLDQHGISLNTLYTRCEFQGQASSYPKGTLIVIKDSAEALFGAWMGEELKLSKGSYYGTGESFLWKYVDGKLKVFKWTGKNDYVALCDPEYLSLGGGDGHYGLYLDDTLLEGSSAWCPTFDNEPLCASASDPKNGGSVSFECVELEVWGIGPT